jgi:hypothetical protein
VDLAILFRNVPPFFRSTNRIVVLPSRLLPDGKIIVKRPSSFTNYHGYSGNNPGPESQSGLLELITRFLVLVASVEGLRKA